MPRDIDVYLEDMLDAATRALEYTSGMDRQAFFEDFRTQDAVLRNLEVIGEAAKNVPDERRATLPSIEWRKMAGMRDMIAHAYFQVDAVIVWDVVDTKLASLVEALRGGLGRA